MLTLSLALDADNARRHDTSLRRAALTSHGTNLRRKMRRTFLLFSTGTVFSLYCIYWFIVSDPLLFMLEFYFCIFTEIVTFIFS